MGWRDPSGTVVEVVRVIDLLVDGDRRDAAAGRTGSVSLPTGFDVMDNALGGGVRTGEVTVVGGPPGIGKTTLALQMARSFARSNRPVLFVSYTDRPARLVDRLALMEVADAQLATDPPRPDGTSQPLDRAGPVTGMTSGSPSMADSHLDRTTSAALRTSAEQLQIVQASSRSLDHNSLRTLVEERVAADQPSVLVVDHLHRVPGDLRRSSPPPATDDLRTDATLAVLKELALERELGVVALAGVDQAGLRSVRRRMHDLRGAPAIAADADVVLLLNSKERIASRIHRTFDPVGTRSFRPWVVVTVEKNRHGPTPVDLELRYDERFSCFDPNGALVTDSLLDDPADEA